MTVLEQNHFLPEISHTKVERTHLNQAFGLFPCVYETSLILKSYTYDLTLEGENPSIFTKIKLLAYFLCIEGLPSFQTLYKLIKVF